MRCACGGRLLPIKDENGKLDRYECIDCNAVYQVRRREPTQPA